MKPILKIDSEKSPRANHRYEALNTFSTNKENERLAYPNLSLLILVFALFSFVVPNQIWAQKKIETTFIVDGECDMCKKRIEKSLDTRGVLFSEWNVETKELFVAFRPGKISIDEIHALINNVGHDTERSLAPDSVYNNIHHCCRYRSTSSPHMITPPDTLSPNAPAHIRSHE